MDKGFYRVELRRVGDPTDLFILFVPLDANGQLDPDGEGPPYLFKAVWDGGDWVGEFKERANQKNNVLVWSPIQEGECQTDMLKVPLQKDGSVWVYTREGRRNYRITGIHAVE